MSYVLNCRASNLIENKLCSRTVLSSSSKVLIKFFRCCRAQFDLIRTFRTFFAPRASSSLVSFPLRRNRFRDFEPFRTLFAKSKLELPFNKTRNSTKQKSSRTGKLRFGKFEKSNILNLKLKREPFEFVPLPLSNFRNRTEPRKHSNVGRGFEFFVKGSKGSQRRAREF